MDKPYSNREISEFMNDIKEAQAKILEQVTRTNGRVSRLEIAVVATVFLLIGVGFKYAIQLLAIL